MGVDLDLFDVLLRVLFLVSIAFLGFFSGKKFNLDQREMSILLVYIISPAVMFVSVLEAPSGRNYFNFTIGAFFVCSITATFALLIGKILWKDSTKYLFAFSGGTGNTGYFGLPLAIGIFDEIGAAVAVFIILGVNLYEFSYGYFLTSRGRNSISESFNRIIKLPIIYSFIIALLIRDSSLNLDKILVDGLNNFKGAYSILGMMVIGVTLSKFHKFEMDWKYFLCALGWKFIVWPLVAVFLIIVFGKNLDMVERAIILLMCTVPMAGNVVVIANELGVHPEKAATAVMASTILAIVTVPVVLSML